MRYGQFDFHNLANPPFFIEKIKQTKKEKKEMPEKRLNKPSNNEFVNNRIVKAKNKGLCQLFWKRTKNIPKSTIIANRPFSNQDCNQRLWAL